MEELWLRQLYWMPGMADIGCASENGNIMQEEPSELGVPYKILFK